MLQKNTKFGRSRYLHFLYRYDEHRYGMYSGSDHSSPEIAAAKIRLLVHALEKGLSVTEKKPNFGEAKAIELISLLSACNSAEMKDRQALELGKSVLTAYSAYKHSVGEDTSFIPEKYQTCSTQLAGKKEFQSHDSQAFVSIANNRHSIRSFASGSIDEEALEKAIALAQSAPSACNRQSSSVYVCSDRGKINQVMARHGGTSGFSNVAAVLALTGNLSLYQNEYERNTVFVDGGIFLLNLLYSLDAFRIAACPIIWGAEPDNDGFLYNLFSIPENEEIISLILIGNYPDQEIFIPMSTRRETKDILHYVK